MGRFIRKTTLTKAQRSALPASDFVFPKRRAYPIPDLYHGRLALIYAMSPSNAAVRDQVVSTVLTRYPSLRSFWAEKSGERMVANPSFGVHMRHNPYGIDAGGATVIVAGASAPGRRSARGKKFDIASGRVKGELKPQVHRTHFYSDEKDGALCGAGKGGNFRLSSAKKVDCYRCIKIHMMNVSGVRAKGRRADDNTWNIEAMGQTTRFFRPSAADKRLYHLMIEGGRQGQFIGRKESTRGGGRFGPSEVEDFRWGGFEHPTQTRRGSGAEIIKRSMKPAIEGPYTGYKIANPRLNPRAGSSDKFVSILHHLNTHPSLAYAASRLSARTDADFDVVIAQKDGREAESILREGIDSGIISARSGDFYDEVCEALRGVSGRSLNENRSNPAVRGGGGGVTLRGDNKIRRMTIEGHRPYAIEFKGHIVSYASKRKADEIAELFAIAAQSGPMMMKDAIRAATAMQFRNNPYGGLYEAPHSEAIILRNPKAKKGGSRVSFVTKDGRVVSFTKKLA